MNFHIITLFPESLSSYINESIIARAQKDKLIKISFYNPRDFVKVAKRKADGSKQPDKPYKRVDDKPYGGGPGMVMQAEPMVKAIEKALAKVKGKKVKIIFLSPGGKQFTNEYAKQTTEKFDHVIIICGRYEGVDARVKKIFKAEEISIGPYVITGGELGAMIIMDTMSRQIEGVLGNFSSVEESRASSHDVYTRPEVFIHKGKKHRVPKILLSGDHAKIDEWRKGEKK